MADEAPPAREPLAPLVVQYSAVTGIPEEYNDFLPKDCEEYKRWASHKEASTAAAKLEALEISGERPPAAAEGAPAAEGEKKEEKLNKQQKKKEKKLEIVIEVSMRTKRKTTTTISGLDNYGVKLADAAKIMGKKFACGASVIKTADQKEHIEVQGEFLQQAGDLILKTYGADKGVKQEHIFGLEGKKKKPLYGGGGGDDDSGSDDE